MYKAAVYLEQHESHDGGGEPAGDVGGRLVQHHVEAILLMKNHVRAILHYTIDKSTLKHSE